MSCRRVLKVSSKEMHTEHVTWNMLERWDLSPNLLFQMAEKNSYKMFPPVVESISEVLKGFFVDELMENLNRDPDSAFKKAEKDYQTLFGDTPKDLPEIYVVSNSMRVRGAASIFYSNVLREVAKKFGTDLILLPSSIHEWLILPYNRDYKLADLENMVYEANTEVVAEREILSYHVYGYVRKTDQLSILSKNGSNLSKALDKTNESC